MNQKLLTSFFGVVTLGGFLTITIFLRFTLISRDPKHTSTDMPLRKQLYIGVMTAAPYLETRALAVHSTWGRDADKLEFFTGGKKHIGNHTDMPVVLLQGMNIVFIYNFQIQIIPYI